MEQQSLTFDQRRIYQISELVDELRGEVEPKFRGIWIQGELSNLSRPGSGHMYFTLKDGDAQISAVCFRMQARYLKFEPERGMDVLVRASVTIYPPRGQLQVVVEHMEPLGRGALQVAFEKLKQKLEEEGLFAPERKKPLPLLPRRIGVVTSPSGAAIRDILRVLERRNDRVSVLIYPCRVQGQGAEKEIAAGVRHLNGRSEIDVIVVTRGGGSLEDLWAFNEEVVARAIAASEKPVLSAVGHEIDFTISDFVADLRAPTPSAAAQTVCGRRDELEETLRNHERRLQQAIQLGLSRARRRLDTLLRSRGFVDSESRLRVLIQRLDEICLRLHSCLKPWFDRRRNQVQLLDRELRNGVEKQLRHRRQMWEQSLARLQAYSPLQVLERGYAIITSEEDKIIRSPDELHAKEKFHVRVARGEFTARKE